MKILLIGPIGSGKTTQAKILSQELNLKLIQTGELIRKKSQEQSLEGKQVLEMMMQGHLVRDEIIAELLKDELNKSNGIEGVKEYANGCIIDSYPRRLSQLLVFDPQIDKAIYIQVSDSVLEERLLKRQRVDDTPEIIERRLRVYHTETAPLLEYYRNLDKLITIDGNGSEKDVAERIKAHLKELTY